MNVPGNTFTLRDLGVLWGISNDKTLAVTVSRYAKRGLLYRVRKGLYSKIPPDRLDYRELGCALMGKYSYLSCESVLSNHGVINQLPSAYTFVGRFSQKVTIGGRAFICRKLSPRLLLNRVGISDLPNYSEASLARAVADMRYYSPMYYLDGETLVDQNEVKRIKGLVGY